MPFGTIVELGILRPGSPLYDERRRVRAEVKADGTLAVPGGQGSIHRLGAFVQGKTACNGWTYWHFEQAGKLKPIDVLRERAKVELGLAANGARDYPRRGRVRAGANASPPVIAPRWRNR